MGSRPSSHSNTPLLPEPSSYSNTSMAEPSSYSNTSSNNALDMLNALKAMNSPDGSGMADKGGWCQPREMRTSLQMRLDESRSGSEDESDGSVTVQRSAMRRKLVQAAQVLTPRLDLVVRPVVGMCGKYIGLVTPRLIFGVFAILLSICRGSALNSFCKMLNSLT